MTKITKQRQRELMKMAKEDPLGTLKTCQAELGTTYYDLKKTQEKLVIVGYACAYEMEGDWDRWLAFIKDPFWSRRKKKPRRDKDLNEKLLLSMKYVFGSIDQRGDQKAWYYFATLEKYFNARVKPENLAARIKADGGMGQAYRDALATRSLARQTKQAEKAKEYEAWGDIDLGSEDSEIAEDDSELDSDADLLDDDSELLPASQTQRASRKQPAFKKSGTKKRVRLIVPQKIRRELLSKSIGQRVRVTLERLERDGRWLRFKVLPASASASTAERARRKRMPGKSGKVRKARRERTWATAKLGQH